MEPPLSSPPPQALRPERIYVGGMDPNLLSVQEVYDRLERHLRADARWTIEKVHLGSCYFQATVSPSSSSRSSGLPHSANVSAAALEEAKKLLHNVKWKGCKLRVEPACPHFLERLAQEREQHRQQQEQTRRQFSTIQHKNSHNRDLNDDKDQESKDKDSVNHGNHEQHSPPPQPQQQQQRRRHYKIRRGYGETVWNVDTKPYQVSDYQGFSKLRSKLKRREQHHAKVLLESISSSSSSSSPKKHHQQRTQADLPKSAAFQRTIGARAIHLRFPGATLDAAAEMANGDQERNEVVEDGEESTSSSSTSSRSDDDEGSQQNGFANFQDGSNKVKKDQELFAEHGQVEDKVTSQHNNKDAKAKTEDRYIWSSSDEESSDESAVGANQGAGERFNNPKPLNEKWNPMDEFAMGGDDATKYSVEGEEEEKKSGTRTLASHLDASKNDEQDWDLAKEEECNNNILSKLFPDLAVGQKLQKPTVSSHKDSLTEQKSCPRAGWAASGVMLRFDPTKQSSQQFVLQEEKKELLSKKEDKEEENDSNNERNEDEETAGYVREHETPVQEEPDDAAEERGNDKEIKTDDNRRQPIYKQGELEAVFREAREEEAAVVVLESVEAAAEAGPSGFSFSFNVGGGQSNNDSKDESPQAVAADQSHPDVPLDTLGSASKSNAMFNQNDNDHDHPNDDEDDDNNAPAPLGETKPSRKRLFSTGFPQEDLDRYVRAFYEFDDGKRILQDLEGYRKDPQVQKSWDEQRRTLTLDWKRKRKAAVARKRPGHFHRHHLGDGNRNS
ncbi:hypothetical protein ACA910_005997 [Epithemia clementina (nom. ined.)]